MNNVIEIHDLRKSYGELTAVDGLSFRVREGELFAFLGVNGAGKSTTISILVGLLRPDSGCLTVLGHPIEEKAAFLHSIGIVFQQSILDKRLSVYDNLYYRSRLYGLGRDQFAQNLAFLSSALDLQGILKRPLNQLSGGQIRKVDLARALIHDPRILILDEPTTGLDPLTRKLVWDLIERLRKERKLTVILTTHYMEEAAIADYVLLIDKGKAVAEGKPIELKERYAGDYLRVYRYEPDFLNLLAEQRVEYRPIKVGVEIKFRSTKQAMGFLSRHSAYIEDAEVIKGTMDDVFLAVTGKELANQ